MDIQTLLSRRAFVVGSIIPLMTACSSTETKTDPSTPVPLSSTPHPTGAEAAAAPSASASHNPIKEPKEWKGIQYHLAGEGKYVAWTVDDGKSPEVIRAYAEFAAKTGVRLTFFINAVHPGFAEHKDLLLPLVKSGQLQIANHTYTHPNLLKLNDKDVKYELEHNEEEIMKLFGVSTKPYFRPPYAFYDERIIKIAAKAGFSRLALWEGTTGDEAETTERIILKRTTKYMQPQRIILGHLNYTTIIPLLEQIKALLDERGLTTVTLRDYYGDATEEEHKLTREPDKDKKPEPAQKPTKE